MYSAQRCSPAVLRLTLEICLGFYDITESKIIQVYSILKVDSFGIKPHSRRGCFGASWEDSLRFGQSRRTDQFGFRLPRATPGRR